MIKNYLLVALRTLKRQPGYMFINVAGLAVGLACCMFILLYVLDELSYEAFHEQADRIVRVVENRREEGQESRLATTYGPLAPALQQDLAAVEHAVRVLPYDVLVRRNGRIKDQEPHFFFVDSAFFDVFTFPLLQGKPSRALNAPFSIVLTTSTARKYFGNTDPIGRTLQVQDDEGSFDFTVTGVAKDPPSNTHLRFDFLASFASMRTMYGTWIDDPRNWDHPPLYTYALLRRGITPADLEAQLPAFALQHMGERRTATRSLHAERLADIRLYSGRTHDLMPGSDITYVYIFSIIALFILLTACVNFVNLATARAAGRTKEVGIRKTLGAHRGQLIRQFLSEAMLITVLAGALAFLLLKGLLPAFNTVAGKALAADALVYGPMPFVFIGLILLVGVLAGSYPAFYLSSFRPARVLKEMSLSGHAAPLFLRRGLIVFQFVITIVFLIGTAIIYRQLHYAQNEQLGFNKEHVVLVPLRDLENQFNYEPLKASWEQLPGVQAVTASSGMPGLSSGLHDFMVFPEGPAHDSLQLMVLTVDPDYAEAYDLQLVAGRDFSASFTTDATDAFLINESAAQRLGWSDPVGKKLTLRYYFNGEQNKVGTVVGVVRDFQYHSLHRSIDPILFHLLPRSYYHDYVSARLQPGALTETLAAMEQAWNRFNSERPFEYTFLDEQFDALYSAEQRLSRLVSIFAGLTILIACLGLFGLAAFTAERRTKEIGIRKVLGASVPRILALLLEEFVRLVLAAFVIAVPLAYLAMHRWLADFAYRIDISPWLFVGAGTLVLAIALLTASYHALQAALADPVKSLRYE